MEEKKEVTLKMVHDSIKLIDSIEPLFTFEMNAVKGEDAYTTNEALARVYADAAFRSHLKKWINRQVYKAATNSDDLKEVWLNNGRIMAVKELYRDMERAYRTIVVEGKGRKGLR